MSVCSRQNGAAGRLLRRDCAGLYSEAAFIEKNRLSVDASSSVQFGSGGSTAFASTGKGAEVTAQTAKVRVQEENAVV